MLKSYADFIGVTLNDGEAVSFDDSGDIASWASDAVNTITQAGLLSGVGNNQFAPKKTATRAEVATLLARFIQDYAL